MNLVVVLEERRRVEVHVVLILSGALIEGSHVAQHEIGHGVARGAAAEGERAWHAVLAIDRRLVPLPFSQFVRLLNSAPFLTKSDGASAPTAKYPSTLID